MPSSEHNKFSWVIRNLCKCDDTEFVDLEEIKTKYGAPTTSVSLGNIIKQFSKM
jgi:hypothetical protein